MLRHICPSNALTSTRVHAEPCGFIPHSVVDRDAGLFRDLELVIRGVPQAGGLIIQGKQVVAQRRDRCEVRGEI